MYLSSTSGFQRICVLQVDFSVCVCYKWISAYLSAVSGFKRILSTTSGFQRICLLQVDFSVAYLSDMSGFQRICLLLVDFVVICLL